MQTCIIHSLKEQQQSPKFMALHNHFLYCFPDVKAGLEHNRGHLTIFRKVFWKISRRVRGLIFHLFPHYLLEEIVCCRKAIWPWESGELGHGLLLCTAPDTGHKTHICLSSSLSLFPGQQLSYWLWEFLSSCFGKKTYYINIGINTFKYS